MFGYISINKPELKIREFDEYQAYYCGLCRTLKQRSGRAGQITLTYDMTFLSVLLTALYEETPVRTMERCPTHPWRKVAKLTNRYTEYAADMNVLLAAYNLQDDWLDDHSAKGLVMYRLLDRQCRRIAQAYPRQSRAVSEYLTNLHRCESGGSADLDLAAGLTGKMLAEIFVCQEDAWAPELRRIGFFLGKFIYLMDAYEDQEEDRKSGSYNPWNAAYPDGVDDDTVLQILTMMMAEVTRAFEQLPVLMNADLIRNILYSGVWSKYGTVRKQHTADTRDDSSEHDQDQHS